MAEACYQERYLPGSFKLIPFKAVEASSEHGRRGAEGEFPFGEQTAYADLGRRIRTYSIRAKFDSNNHILEAAALIAACETPGPGILTHPTRGVILSAACRSVRVTDRMEDEGGVTYVDLEFVEANNWPNGLSLVGQFLGLGLSAIIGQSSASFRTRYRPSEIQPFRRQAVVGTAQGQVDNIRAEYQRVTVARESDEDRQRVLLDLTNLASDDAMASDTDTMDKGLTLGANAVALETSGVEKFRAFRRIANGAARQSSFSSPAREAEDAVYSHVRIIAAAHMTEGALDERTSRSGDIFEQIDVIDAVLSQEMEIARCDNRLFLALAEFRASAIAQLYEKAYNAPGLVEYNFGGKVHALKAAYAIYGDAKRHRELEAVNITGASGRIGPGVIAERLA